MDDPRELRSEVPEWFADAMRVPREEGTVAVEGCPIHYFRWGDPASPGLILLHGGRAHARCFAFVAPLLAKQFHVVAYDMSGLGDSGRREEYSHELHAREVLAVALATGMLDGGRKPFLAGHSRGAGGLPVLHRLLIGRRGRHWLMCLRLPLLCSRRYVRCGRCGWPVSGW